MKLRSDFRVFRGETGIAVVDWLPHGNWSLANGLGRFETLCCIYWHFSSHLISLLTLSQLPKPLNLHLVVLDLSLNVLRLGLGLGLLLPDETVVRPSSDDLGGRLGLVASLHLGLFRLARSLHLGHLRHLT